MTEGKDTRSDRDAAVPHTSPPKSCQDTHARAFRPGIALALPGSGFRASIFHLGVIRKLAELGRLSQVDMVATVSGGSILGAFMVLRWKEMLRQGNCERAAFRPLRNTIIPNCQVPYSIPIKQLSCRTSGRRRPSRLLGNVPPIASSPHPENSRAGALPSKPKDLGGRLENPPPFVSCLQTAVVVTWERTGIH